MKERKQAYAMSNFMLIHRSGQKWVKYHIMVSYFGNTSLFDKRIGFLAQRLEFFQEFL